MLTDGQAAASGDATRQALPSRRELREGLRKVAEHIDLGSQRIQGVRPALGKTMGASRAGGGGTREEP